VKTLTDFAENGFIRQNNKGDGIICQLLMVETKHIRENSRCLIPGSSKQKYDYDFS